MPASLTTCPRIETDTCPLEFFSLECGQDRRVVHVMKFAGMLLLFTGMVAAVTLAQSDEAGTRSKVIALEQLWNQAYKSGDTKALDAILDDGIVLVNDDGSV